MSCASDAFLQPSSMCANVSFPNASSMFWKPHQFSWFKLNCAAAINAQQGIATYGVVIRNHESLIMFVGVGIGVYSYDVNVAEVEALFYNLQEAGLSTLIIKSGFIVCYWAHSWVAKYEDWMFFNYS